MPDFGAPVAQNVDVSPQRGIQTLSGILGLKAQQQGLAGQAAQVQQEQQTAGQRSGIAAFMAHFDPTQHVGPDGTLDLDNVLTDPKLRQAAGDQFPQLMQQMIQAKQGQLNAKRELAALNGTLRDQFSSTVGSLRTDPDVVSDNPAGRSKVQQAMWDYAQSGGPDAARVANIYAQVINHVPQGKLSQTLSNFQLQAMDASTQAGKQAPTFADTGPKLAQTNPQAAGGAPAGDLTKAPAPGRQPFTDSFGVVYTFNPQTSHYEPAKQQPGKTGGGPGASNPGDVQALEAQANQNFANVNANRVAASLAPQQLDQINKALELSKSVSTGNWAQKRSEIESGLSSIIPGLSTAQNDATKLQLLDKFSERIAADSARVLGANASTDAARDSIHRQNANIGYTPQAVQNVLKYGQAQTLAMQAKGDAQEAWLKRQGNGITNQHDFETQWRQSYDPVLFQLEAADPAERIKIVQGLSPQEAASLSGKRAKLREFGATVQ